MNRKEWERQIQLLRDHIKNNDIKSHCYWEGMPLLSYVGEHYIKQKLQLILANLQHLENYKGSKTFKKICLAKFQSYTNLLKFDPPKEINWYFRLEDIIEAGEKNE